MNNISSIDSIEKPKEWAIDAASSAAAHPAESTCAASHVELDSFHPFADLPPIASPSPQKPREKKRLESSNYTSAREPSSSSLQEIFRSAFATIDIDHDTLPVSLQSEFSSALLQQMKKMQSKRKERPENTKDSAYAGLLEDEFQEPHPKRIQLQKEGEFFYRENRDFYGSEGSGLILDMGLNVDGDENGIVPPSADDNQQHVNNPSMHTRPGETDQGAAGYNPHHEIVARQHSLLISWFAEQLQNAEQSLQKRFEAQSEAHRVEIEKLKSEHAKDAEERTKPHDELKRKEVEPQIENAEVEDVDKSRVYQALEDHLSLRRQLLDVLKEDRKHDAPILERVVEEHVAYLNLQNAIYAQLELQQCHHFNLQSRDRAIIEEKNCELKRLGEALNEKSMELQELKQKVKSKDADPGACQNGQEQQEQQQFVGNLQKRLNQKQLENHQLAQNLQQLTNAGTHYLQQNEHASSQIQNLQQLLRQRELENDQLMRRVQEMTVESLVLDSQQSQVSTLQQTLHREQLANSTLKLQLQEAVNTSAQTLTQSNALHSKEIKNIVLGHLGKTKACAHRMEQMADTIKRLSSENRGLDESVSKHEESLDKMSRTIDKLSAKNREYYSTIEKLMTNDKDQGMIDL